MYSRDVHIWDKLDTWYTQACLINQQAGKHNRQAVQLTDIPVARWMKLGSDIKVANIMSPNKNTFSGFSIIYSIHVDPFYLLTSKLGLLALFLSFFT